MRRSLAASLENHIYKWDEVVIGNNLASFVYTRNNDSKLILSGLKDVFKYDLFTNKQVLKNIEHPTMVANKKTLIDQLLFDLVLQGKCPISEKVNSIRVNAEENLLSVFISDTVKITIKYNSLRIFDDSLVTGLPFETSKRTAYYVVYDWFLSNINRDTHFLELYDIDSPLAHRVIIRKIPQNVVISQSSLTAEQLNNFNFSDTMCRFKTDKMLKDSDLRGPRNGFYKNSPNKPRYRPIKLDFMRREVMPQVEREFVKYGNITFDNEEL